MKLISLLFLIAFFPTQAIDIDADIPLAHRVILKPSDIVRRFCEGSNWVPTFSQTEEALHAVQAYLVNLKTHVNGSESILGNLKKYRVQFVGEKRDGKKVIWCNFFPVAQTFGDEDKQWKRMPIMVSDGGYLYWQIDYDPKTVMCSNFSVNGYA